MPIIDGFWLEQQPGVYACMYTRDGVYFGYIAAHPDISLIPVDEIADAECVHADDWTMRESYLDGRLMDYDEYRERLLAGADLMCGIPENDWGESLPVVRWSVLEPVKIREVFDLFFDAYLLEEVAGLELFDMSGAESCQEMFRGCRELRDISGVADWDMSNVKNMVGMFAMCSSVGDFSELRKWSPTSVENMVRMFVEASGMDDVSILDAWNATNLIDTHYIFYDTAIGDWRSYNSIGESTSEYKRLFGGGLRFADACAFAAICREYVLDGERRAAWEAYLSGKLPIDDICA